MENSMSGYKSAKVIMTKYEIGLLIWVVLLSLQVMQDSKRIDKIGWRMTEKMDKPKQETLE